ncbi:MAG: hypothetical protein LBT91_02890, partial [Bifidobacteriaceae bacterium]|nr:hypothetical protein [Bifidobacteriaceae bacterium]
MDRYGKKLLILFSCLAGIIVILASSLFLVSWFWSNQIVQKSLDSEYTDNKSSLASSAAEDTKNNVDQDSDNKKLTQEEKDKMVAEGIGSLEDGTRSVVVNLADINLSDLKEANPEVLDSKLNQILAEANDANSQNNKISDEYKKAVALKQNKFLAQLSKSSGKISVSAKYKTIPSMVFTVDYGGLNSINSSDLV